MKIFNSVVAAAGLALVSAGANAALISVQGATVSFSFDDSIAGYSISGDTLSFFPAGILAEQNASVGLDSSSFSIPLVNIYAKSGYALTGLAFKEQGDYLRIEDSANTTGVKVTGAFYVNDDAQSISPSQPLSTALSPSEFFNPGAEASLWSAEYNVALNSVASVATRVDNTLFAGVFANGFNFASIRLGQLAFSLNTVQLSGPPAEVPLPGAVWLFGSALAGVLVSRRKNLVA
ncbi:hypothetical protein NP590_14110 [Methylomonas sp. SURF-2]|uniref:PEP-CTERM protein-sorting domain-containing protein n=1 Tax=Methylomonas subterranea TaxID=2952225 RepID=A0ABT1TIG1_9GAMM|nr:hypothetical protein [Methylomonas sp. SURF-2]MCQ8105245.1 hypothetical protein [Methylomonas sp. SURF-2]